MNDAFPDLIRDEIIEGQNKFGNSVFVVSAQWIHPWQNIVVCGSSLHKTKDGAEKYQKQLIADHEYRKTQGFRLFSIMEYVLRGDA